MAPTDDISSLLGVGDLNSFNQSVVQNDPYGIAGRGLGAWQPDISTWSPTETGVTMFAKSFLSGLLGNYAQQNAANQLNSVIGVLPQLESNPMSVMAPEGVDAAPFAALKGSAVLKNYIGQASAAAEKKKTLNDLLTAVVGDKFKNGDMLAPEAIKALGSGDPAAALTALSADDGTGSHVSRLLDSYGITDPTARAGIRTPEEAKNYLLHVQVDQTAKDAAQAKKDAKKASSDTQLENKLRAELEKVNSPHQTAVTIAPLLIAAQDNAAKTTHTPIDDLALVDTYNKVINPGGVLRAQLVEQVKEAQNPLHRLAGQIENVTNGGTFDATGRQQLLDSLKAVASEKISAGKAFADGKLAIARNKMGEDSIANILDPTYYQNIYGGISDSLTAAAAPVASDYSSPQDYLTAYRQWEAQSAK